MGKKLKRDFKERQTIKEEAKILEKENVSTNESSRLKHGDDYRGKIIHDKDRFQDKIHEKTSKINVENDHIQGVFKRNARYTKGAYENQNTAINDKSRYEAHDDFMSSKDSKGFKEVNNHSSSAEISEKDKNPAFDKKSELQKIKMAGKVRNSLNTDGRYSQNEEVYDSLGKDLDNDGIIDRYDNAVGDSDYFESAYDVEDNLHTRDKAGENSSKRHKAQKKQHKRKNYSDKLYTRNIDDTPKKDNVESKAEGKKTGKEVIAAVNGKEKKDRLSKEQKKALKNKASKVSVLSGLAKGSETIRDYLSHGSDENQGVETGEKIADVNSKLIHGIKNYASKKKSKKSYNLSKKDYKIRKRKSKLEFREAKEELKKTDEYKKADAFKKFQKRKQMKSSIRKQNRSRLRDRIKEGVLNTLKSSKDMVIRKAKGLMVIIIGLIILGTFVVQFAGTSMTGMMNSASGVLTTTYLSDQTVLSEINQQFSGLEEGLQDEIDSLEENNLGYDEYII